MILIKRLSIILLVSLLAQSAFGQRWTVHKKKKSYIGFNAGFNFSAVKITDRYSVLSAVGSSEDEDLQKKYAKFGKNRGAQFGINYTYNFSNSVAMLVGFGYQSLGFNYVTHYAWVDTIGTQSFNREMHHRQKISYFSVPLLARWDLSNRELMPYVQGGVFMDFRHQAKKIIHYDNTIDEKETENEISKSAMVPLTDHTRKFNMGIMAGVGLSYYTKFATFGIETNFKYGLLKVIDDRSRYADYTGFALQYLDVMDQLKLSTLNFQFSVSIPINHSLTTNILRKRKY